MSRINVAWRASRQTAIMATDPDFAVKLRIVSGWSRAHAATLPTPEREAWEKFAAFLEMMAQNMSR